MATTPTVLGTGPFEYTDPKGKQVLIPLSALVFKNGQLSVDSTKWPTPNSASITLPGFVNPMLGSLAQQDLIVPVPTPAPKPAMTLTAADAGSAGNGIKVTITTGSLNVDPTQTTFSLKIEETDTYPGLMPTTIATVLGTDKSAGTQPGLVHVVQSSLPAAGMPAAVSKQPFTQPAPPPPPPPPGPNAQSVLMNNAKTPAPFVTLEAKKIGADGALTVVTIANVTGTTFDLTAYWTKTVSGLTLANLQSNLANMSYELTILAPPSGIISVPASAAVQLTGGIDGSPGTAASAIVFAAQ